jgi:hypothetical protein
LSARYGWDDLPDNVLQALGRETIKRSASSTVVLDLQRRMTACRKRMTREAVPENGSVFDVSEEVFDHIFDGIE